MTNIYPILKAVKGTTIVRLDTSTIPSNQRKTIDTENGREPNPHYGRASKVVSGVVLLCAKYDAMVKRRLEKEGKDPESFEVQPRKWGTKIEGTPFVIHNGKYYLEVFYLNQTTQYYLDGKPVDKSEIIGLPDRQEAEQGGLSDKVIIRTVSIDNIKQLKVQGEVYTKFTCERT